jgi:hypothetical protein
MSHHTDNPRIMYQHKSVTQAQAAPAPAAIALSVHYARRTPSS